MKIKVGDKVLVITGKDKGKEGNVLKTFKKDSKLIVEGVNMVKKHMKPNQKNETGGILDMESPIHVSNVKLVSVASKKESKKEPKKVPAKETVKEAKTTAKKTTKKTEKKAD